MLTAGIPCVLTEWSDMLHESARICCLGFQKTGTSSLAEALDRLGYSVTNVNREVDARLAAGVADPQKEAEEIACAGLRDHHVIQDSPAAFVYEALDRAYPGSKFILTTRPFEKWMASYAKFFPDENSALRKWMYGCDRLSGNEARYREIYERQHAAIRRHFADRPGDFMEFDLAGGDGWYELVGFLGRDALPSFPHMNPGDRTRRRRYNTGAKTLVRRLMRSIDG